MIGNEIKEFVYDNFQYNYSKELGYFFFYCPEKKTYINIAGNFVYDCREILAWCWKKNPTHNFDYSNYEWIGFKYNLLDIEKLNSSWEKIEAKLKIPDENKTIFFKTNYKDANQTVIIKVSKFWTENHIKKSIFSLLLRLVAVYGNDKNYNEAIQDYPLALSVKNTLDWFLKGNTHVVKDTDDPFKKGFVVIFRNKTQEEIEKMLIKPPVLKKLDVEKKKD